MIFLTPDPAEPSSAVKVITAALSELTTAVAVTFGGLLSTTKLAIMGSPALPTASDGVTEKS